MKKVDVLQDCEDRIDEIRRELFDLPGNDPEIAEIRRLLFEASNNLVSARHAEGAGNPTECMKPKR